MKIPRFPALLAGLIVGLALALPAAADGHDEKTPGKGGPHKVREKVRDATDEAEDAAARADRARGEAMRERRDERKAIMEEAKSAAEPGTPRAGKKPWWKFWGAEPAE